jgi:hypothetical protein
MDENVIERRRPGAEHALVREKLVQVGASPGVRVQGLQLERRVKAARDEQRARSGERQVKKRLEPRERTPLELERGVA